MLFCSRADAVPESYLRYLVHGMRDQFDLPGTPIRITGQDTERGTFSHRHAALNDGVTGAKYIPLQHLDDAKASI